MDFLKNHGTKVLGTVGTVASVLATADPAAVVDLLGSRGPFIVTGVLSILTIMRGFTNSANASK